METHTSLSASCHGLKVVWVSRAKNLKAIYDIYCTIKVICPCLNSLNFSYGIKYVYVYGAEMNLFYHHICFHLSYKVILPVSQTIN